MPDSSAIDAAIIAKLVNDATLVGLMPDGVWFDAAAQGKTRFVVVSLVEEFDEGVFGSRGYEDAVYLVKAVEKNADGVNIKAAAARIDVLLEDVASLTATGYNLMTVHREERVRYTEVDQIDPSIRWQHRGGRYRVQYSL